MADLQSKYFERYLAAAVGLIDGYRGEEPFHLYLKKYFSANKKHGSRDRKVITALCYDYFRLGRAVSPEMTTAERIETAIQIIEGSAEGLQGKKSEVSINTKVLFPFQQQLSSEIDRESFGLSFLNQPQFFLRIRPGHKKKVVNALRKNNIPFDLKDSYTIALKNTTNTDGIIRKDADAVIQDYNSQRIATFFDRIRSDYTEGADVWDACAGSGGKSILAFDFLPLRSLTVTDTRKNILHNLKKRFARAGIQKYNLIQADLTKPINQIPDDSFDFVIADVPCSGSGTWGRSPENLLFFQSGAIVDYAGLQRKITGNLVKKLRPGGYLLYITCSVFAAENEDNIRYLTNPDFNLQVVKQDYLKGYEIMADTLFAALLQKL